MSHFSDFRVVVKGCCGSFFGWFLRRRFEFVDGAVAEMTAAATRADSAEDVYVFSQTIWAVPRGVFFGGPDIFFCSILLVVKKMGPLDFAGFLDELVIMCLLQRL